MNDGANLRIGLLGAGRIGSMHAELLQFQVPNAMVADVYDIMQPAAEAVATKVGPTVFATAEELITSPEVDAVAIATSTDTHVKLIVAAADANKPIFCEKPVSLAIEEVDRALAAVDAAQVPLQIGFNRRFDAGHAAVQQAVASGTIGEVRQVTITSRDPSPPPISYVEVSGGIFNDMTIHDFDMARFVTGADVEEVFAYGAVMVDPAIGDAGDFDTITVLMRHSNGVQTTITNCRQAAYGYDQRVEAFGSLGVSTSENQADHYTVTRTEQGGATAVVPHFFLDRYIPSYVTQWQQFVEAVTNGTPTPVNGHDGRAPLVIGKAALRSAKEQRPVKISEIDA